MQSTIGDRINLLFDFSKQSTKFFRFEILRTIYDKIMDTVGDKYVLVIFNFLKQMYAILSSVDYLLLLFA